MRVRTVVRFCLIFVMVLFNDQKANGLPGNFTDINDNSTTEAIGSTTETISSTTKNIMSTAEKTVPTTENIVSITETTSSTTPSNVTKQEIDLNATDLKNTLQVLLDILNKKPDLATLKVVGRLINDIINQDLSTKQLNAKLLHELRKHVELKGLIDDLMLDSAKTESPSQFELFPTMLRDAIIEEVLKFHNLSELATENVTSTEDYSTNTPENDDLTTTPLEEKYINEEQESESPNNSENSTLEFFNVTTTADNLQENNSISYAITTPSSEISTIETMEVTTTEQQNQTVTIVNVIEKTLNRGKITKTFPSLSNNLLKMLKKYNMKYVRTYSEILEPLPPKEIKNKNQRNKGNCKQVKCQSAAKYKQNRTTKKTKNKPKKKTERKTDKSAKTTTSQQTESSSSSRTSQSITSELFNETTTRGISSVESTSIPSTNAMDITFTSIGRRLAATTRKPNRPPGNTYGPFTSRTPPLLSTRSDGTYTEF